MADIAASIEQGVQDGTLVGSAMRKSIDRVRERDALLILAKFSPFRLIFEISH
jgi:hypothetical protein